MEEGRRERGTVALELGGRGVEAVRDLAKIKLRLSKNNKNY